MATLLRVRQMNDKITSLVTDCGFVLHISEKVAAMVEELWAWHEQVDGCTKGQIVIDFNGGSVKSALRTHSEGRRGKRCKRDQK